MEVSKGSTQVITDLFVIQNHPLVVVGAAVELFKDLGPLLARGGQPVGHHHPENVLIVAAWY